MKVFAQSLLVLLMVGVPQAKSWSQAASTHVVTDAEYERWKKDLSNWGRWGKDDEIGALNLITPEKRTRTWIRLRTSTTTACSTTATSPMRIAC